MLKYRFKPALMAALFIGPLAGCGNAPQGRQTAANESSDCAISPAQSSLEKARYHQASDDRSTDNSPTMIDIALCTMLAA